MIVDWKKVEENAREMSEEIAQRLVEEEKEGSSAKKLMQQGVMFVKNNVVTAGGFAAGFLLGLAT